MQEAGDLLRNVIYMASSSTYRAQRNRLTRLLQIIDVLRASRPSDLVTRQVLAEACGSCHVRTIQRDMAILEDVFQCKFEYDHRSKSYKLGDVGWRQAAFELSIEDVIRLSLLRDIAAVRGTPEGEPIRALIARITQVLPVGMRVSNGDASHVTKLVAARSGATERDYSRAPVAALIKAQKAQHTVTMLYRSRSGREEKWRDLDPYQVAAREGRFWEVHGWCHVHNQVRTFALDQVRDLRELPQSFVVHTDSWAEFQAKAGVIGGLRGAAEVRVEAVFDAIVAEYAMGRQWPETLTVTMTSENTAHMCGHVLGVAGISAELLSWGSHVCVLGGLELRATMQAETLAMAALYGGAADASGQENN